jgi:hypothetical protein
MPVKPATPHVNGVVKRPGALNLGRLVELTLPVYIDRPTGKTGANGEPEYAEVELAGWDYKTVRGEIKAQIRVLSDAYNKIVRPDPDDIDPEDGQPRFVANRAGWEHYIASVLKLLVPDMTADEATFLTNWGANSEMALHTLFYLGFWARDPLAKDDQTAEASPNPEAVTGASS